MSQERQKGDRGWSDNAWGGVVFAHDQSLQEHTLCHHSITRELKVSDREDHLLHAHDTWQRASYKVVALISPGPEE